MLDIDNLDDVSRSKAPVGGLTFCVGFFWRSALSPCLYRCAFLGRTHGQEPRLTFRCDGLFLLATAFCSVGMVRYPFHEMTKLPSVRWALLFLGFSCLSLLWSSTASLPNSAAYWCAMAADLAIVVMLLRAGPALGVSDSLMKGFIWGACMVAVIAWLIPQESDLRLGDDELLGPNQIGYVCAFAFFFAQYLMRERRATLVAPAFVLAVTLFRTLSKTTIVAFLIGEGFLLMRDKSIGRRSKILIAFATTAVTAMFWGLLTSYYDVYTNAGNQSETLTGRLGIWAYFLSEAIQRPWIGHGFDSAWKVIPPFGPEQFEAAHAHNELIQQFYAYGVIGICLFAGIYWSVFRQIHRLSRGPRKIFFLAFLIFVLVRGIADTERFDLSLPLWAIVMISLLIEQARNSPEQTCKEGGRSLFT